MAGLKKNINIGVPLPSDNHVFQKPPNQKLNPL
jgi:hypothetical protein